MVQRKPLNPTVENAFVPSVDGKCRRASGGMVAAAFPEASKAGAQMLEMGGNAVDAACAAALALGVCEPQASGIGGQTMAMVSMDRRTIFLNGSGRAPLAARADRVRAADVRFGYRATTVPSTIAVLGRMHARYGRLEWQQLFAPAIEIARRGYVVTALQHRLQVQEMDNFARVPSRSGARYFLKDGQGAYAPGEIFCQPQLASLLGQLAAEGPEAFYTGDIARRIAADMAANGGFLSLEDLEDIPWPREHTPLSFSYRGLVLHSPPPPSQGRGLQIMLRLFDLIKSGDPDRLAENEPVILAEIVRRSLAALGAHPVYPERYDPGADPLLGDAWLENTARAIAAGGKFPLPGAIDRPEGGETTHLSVMDRDGNAVGLTQSVNLVYGAKAAARDLGFLYNNYLLDANRTDPDHPHFLRPGGLPVSMVCPTIVCRQQRPWLVTGSPGSARILSTVFQFLLHIIDKKASIRTAMERPRLHGNPEGLVSLEADRFPSATVEQLVRAGYRLDRRRPESFYLGAIHCVLHRMDGGGFQGAADIRRDGQCRGVAHEAL
jgi:gamma-glutamyltranspeptidase/glutathione hydrolase